MNAYPVVLKPTYSVWLGALARIDYLSGDGVNESE